MDREYLEALLKHYKQQLDQMNKDVAELEKHDEATHFSYTPLISIDSRISLLEMLLRNEEKELNNELTKSY